MDLKEESILGEKIGDHWYYSSKSKALMQFLAPGRFTSILDVGAGSGFFTKFLLAKTDAKQAWCVDTSYDGDSADQFLGKPLYMKTSIDHVDVDLVLLMDVLEHVVDDVQLLSEYVQKVPNDTHFLITVPAFQFLWSGHDEFLEHKRRYTLSSLEATVKKAGLKINRSTYYFLLVFPIAALLRFFKKLFQSKKEVRSELKQHSYITNQILKGLCSIELSIMKRNRLAGLCIFCLAKKVS